MKLLRAEEVAVILDVSRSTARRMMIDGTLPAIPLRSGKRKKIYRVRESELERYVLSLERQSVKSRPARLAVVDAGQRDSNHG